MRLPHLTDLGHALGGLITSLLSSINPVLSVLCFLGFIIYELDEDWRIKDGAWRDIRTFLIGLFIGAAIDLLLYYLLR